MAELSSAELRRLHRGGHYLVRGDSTRPSPVVPSFGADRPIPSITPEDRRAARELLELREILSGQGANG